MVAVCLLPTAVMLGGIVLLDESSISRGPDALAGGDRHSVELTEARNQSWQLQDTVGLLRVHWVS